MHLFANPVTNKELHTYVCTNMYTCSKMKHALYKTINFHELITLCKLTKLHSSNDN